MRAKIPKILLIITIISLLSPKSSANHYVGYWGFYGHKLINRLAVFSLPPPMLVFYKKNIVYLTENAVNPDERRYAVEGEAERHYLDADVYGDSAAYKLPRYWKPAVDSLGEDSLRAYGIVPWHAYKTYYSLVKALEARNTEAILRISADLGHYLGDANVPLHTTQNYNGQLTGQRGIHGLWESRLPELFSQNYALWVGQAEYIAEPQLYIWSGFIRANEAVDSVLRVEKTVSQLVGENKKWAYEERNGVTVRTYSRHFAQKYQAALNGQVERQLRASVKMVADLWYTAWVEAGQPDLSELNSQTLTEQEKNILDLENIIWQHKEHVLDRNH